MYPGAPPLLYPIRIAQPSGYAGLDWAKLGWAWGLGWAVLGDGNVHSTIPLGSFLRESRPEFPLKGTQGNGRVPISVAPTAFKDPMAPQMGLIGFFPESASAQGSRFV